MRDFKIPPNIIYGIGAINSLAKHVNSFGRVAFLVTGRKSMKRTGITDKIKTQLLGKNVKTVIFDDVNEDPCLEIVDKGLEIAREERIDFVIGLGGGSALDTAKAIAGIFNENCSVKEFVLHDRPITKKGLKFIACPTTSGSGTEVTKNAVLTIKEIPAKKSIRHQYLIPDLAIVDPELTLSLPKKYTAGCGLDALTHAIEAYTSINAFEITDTLALRAISLIGESLITAYKQPENIEAREKMAWASNLAGMAFSNGGLGAAHALAHPLGIYFKIPHGIINAVLLTAVMKFNLDARKEKFIKIARALSKDKKAKHPGEAVERVGHLKRELNLNMGLHDFGIKRKDFPALAEGTKYSASIKSNPIGCGKDELIKILEMAY